MKTKHKSAEIAQLGERQTEDLNVPSSIPGFGNMFIFLHHAQIFFQALQELVGQQSEKNQHFMTHFCTSILKNYSISFVANADT